MIRVLGAVGSKEYQAAIDLPDLVLDPQPNVENDHNSQISIIAGSWGHGQKVRDIDLILLAHLGNEIKFEPLLAFQKHDGSQAHPAHVIIDSLYAVIEAMSYSEPGVRFIGKTVEVAYGRHR